MGGGTYAANEMNPGFDIGMIVVYRNYPDQKPYYLPDDTLCADLKPIVAYRYYYAGRKLNLHTGRSQKPVEQPEAKPEGIIQRRYRTPGESHR
jgi:hypothetical protein